MSDDGLVPALLAGLVSAFWPAGKQRGSVERESWSARRSRKRMERDAIELAAARAQKRKSATE